MRRGLVQIRRKRKVGQIMGELEIIKLNTGERTIFQTDGSVIKDQVPPPKIEWCDRCQSFKEAEFGRYDKVMGSNELFYCAVCK